MSALDELEAQARMTLNEGDMLMSASDVLALVERVRAEHQAEVARLTAERDEARSDANTAWGVVHGTPDEPDLTTSLRDGVQHWKDCYTAERAHRDVVVQQRDEARERAIPDGLTIIKCARCGGPVLVEQAVAQEGDMECCPRCTHEVSREVADESRAAIERLTAEAERNGQTADQVAEWWKDETQKHIQAQAAIDRVRALHRGMPVASARSDFWCEDECGPWPCPTIRALDGDTTGGEGRG